MNGPELTLWQRLILAFWAFFTVLFRLDVARAVHAARERRRLGAGSAEGDAGGPPAARLAEPAPAAPAGPSPEVVSRRAALQLLAALQREGRLVDFIEEDLAGYPDATVGAAARAVHAGCKKAIQEYFRLEPVLREPEGATVEVRSGFDPAAVRLTGNVVGAPPFKGALRHHGWRAQDVRLPQASDGMDPAIVAPAEVEL
ncbi:MAG TPA: DUF2760 domain-containing protein [Anaeromyxobacter sp.]|nr:DUF2760 domain-containing protein [Anaeromyxobacter sp.]